MPSRLEMNVGGTERALSVVAGSYLLVKAVKGMSFTRAALGGYLLYRGATGNCPLYTAVGKKEVAHRANNVKIHTSMLIHRPHDEVYNFWRRLDNLPLFMGHLVNVTETDKVTSEWVAKLPGKLGKISWQSEIVEDEPGKRISWRSLPGSSVENYGNVEFIDAGDNVTEVNIDFSYHAPMGRAGEGIARLLNPVFEEMVMEDILNLKRFLESDEVQGRNMQTEENRDYANAPNPGRGEKAGVGSDGIDPDQMRQE